MALDSITEQVIAGLIVLLIAAIAAWLWRRIRRNNSVKVEPFSFDEKVYRLLEAIYDLADGNPGNMVSGQEAAQQANIPHTTEDFDPVARHLQNSWLIRAQDVYLEALTITPAGIREIERRKGRHVTPGSTIAVEQDASQRMMKYGS